MASVKFHVTSKDFVWAGLGISQACRRIGASVTLSSSGATHAFAASDAGALDLAEASASHGLPFATKQALEAISDRIALAGLGVPSIRSVRADTPDSIAGAFDGPVFVKKQMPFGKQSGRWVYTNWNSVSELIDAADDSFWSGEYVIQEYLGDSVSGFDTTIAVNELGDVLPVVNTKFTFSNACTSNSASSDELPSQHVMDSIQSAVRALGIKGGIYGIQIAQKGDQQLVMDWNVRPGVSHTMYLMGRHKIFDRALAHIAGLPLPDTEHIHIENRHYPNAMDKADLARSLGLIVRFDLTPGSKNPRVGLAENSLTLLAVGQTKAEVAEKLQSFESNLV